MAGGHVSFIESVTTIVEKKLQEAAITTIEKVTPSATSMPTKDEQKDSSTSQP